MATREIVTELDVRWISNVVFQDIGNNVIVLKFTADVV